MLDPTLFVSKNTADLSFRLPYIQVGTRMSGRLNNRPEHEIEDSVDVMEIFCDSDWAGNANRRSTTSVVILLNSLVVLSYSRTQKAVSLSSCEAEVLALTSGASEAMLLKEVWMFIYGRTRNLARSSQWFLKWQTVAAASRTWEAQTYRCATLLVATSSS